MVGSLQVKVSPRMNRSGTSTVSTIVFEYALEQPFVAVTVRSYSPPSFITGFIIVELKPFGPIHE